MEFKDKNILIISPEPWNHIFLSKHNYAITLGAIGAHVFFANPPGNHWSLKETDYTNVKELNYTKFTKGIRFLPSVISSRMIKKKLDKIEKFCNVTFDIIWSFDNSVFFDFSLLKPICISHIVDLNQDFEFEKAAKNADLCLYCSKAIGDKMRKYNSNSHFINHGYLSKRNNHEVKIPVKEGIKIGYAGNLDIKYLDWEMLENAFSFFENVYFYFAGPLINPGKYSEYPNVSYIGKIGSNELESFYQQMDILIICYRADKYVDQLANPHKMMEYLASGKPIVASFTKTYEGHNFINMCKSRNEWISKLKETVNHIDYWNQEKFVNCRKQLAFENSYEKHVEKIMDLVDEKNHV